MEQKYLFTAICAALKAGEKILSIYNDPTSDFQIERKADNSPLTIADREAHEVIVAILDKTPFPILSEEGKHLDYSIRREWQTLWIVDPLDGTKEFIKRNGDFTVNIALVREGVPIAGVIYLPVQRDIYFAADGLGAYKLSDIIRWEEDATLKGWIEKAIRLPQKEERDLPVVVASRSHLSAETEEYIARLKQKYGGAQLVSRGSSIKICLVAEGRADVYPRFAPTMEWDTAAGHAIARAAGMEIYHTDGKQVLHYNKENLLNPWFIVEKKENTLI